MSTTTPLPTLPEPAADFLASVTGALADLPDGEREDLTEEVAAHLVDVADELGTDLDAASLRVRLGSAEAYAAELRSAAGYDVAPVERVRLRRRLGVRTSGLRTNVEGLPGAEGVRRLVVELRPGWWVVRAWVLLTWLSLSSGIGVIPRATGNGILNLAVFVGALVCSVWLGRRVTASHVSRSWRRTAILGNVILAVGSIVVFDQIQARGSGYSYVGEPKAFATASPLGEAPAATNLFAFTPDGKLIPQFYLYDQNGQPVDIGDESGCADPSASASLPFDNAYPREQYTQRTDAFGDVIQDCVPTGRTPAFSVAIPTPSSAPSASTSPSGG